MFAFFAFDPLHYEPGFLFWSTVVFVLLFFILAKVGWGPLAKSIEDREAKIRGDIESAEKARDDAEAKLAELNQRLDEANLESRKILDEARDAAEASKQKLMADARSQAEGLRQQAEKDISVARDRAISDIKSQVVDISVSISEKVLGRSVDAADTQRMADEVIARAGGLN